MFIFFTKIVGNKSTRFMFIFFSKILGNKNRFLCSVFFPKIVRNKSTRFMLVLFFLKSWEIKKYTFYVQ
jgi:hypothetical protein